MTTVRGGQHRTFELAKQQLDHLKNWYKQLYSKAPPSSTNWVLKDHNKIVKDIIEKKDKPYADNSKKSFYSSLAKVILILKGNNLDDPLYLKYSNISTELGKKVQTVLDNQELTENQKKVWISFSQLEELVQKAYDKIDEGSIENMYKGLIASLYFYHPPVRVDYGAVKILKTKKVPKDKKNYMIKEDGKYVVYLRDYKMAWKNGVAKVKFSTDLTKVIDDTLDFLPRKYLLTPANDVNKPLGDSQLQKAITNIFGFGVDILRKIYGSHFFKKYGGNKIKVSKLAEQMLHDPATFYQYYLKFVPGDIGYIGDDEVAEENMRPNVAESSRMAQERQTTTPRTTAKHISTQTAPVSRTIETQTDKERLLGDAPFTPVAYSREYKKAHPEKAKADNRKYFEKHREEVLRAKLVRNLNTGMTSTPTQTSITKYRLRKVGAVWV